MSEAIDIDTDNLCTTEDAFEQFQAVSMYEEDEYITLSDIVSSPPTNHDLNKILHDMPNEDVTSLMVLEENIIQTAAIAQNIEENIQETQRCINETSVDNRNCQLSAHTLPDESVAVYEGENYTNNVIPSDTNRVLNGNIPKIDNTIPHVSTSLQDPANSRKRRPCKRKNINKKGSTEKIVKRKARLPKSKNICDSVSLEVDDKKNSVTSTLENVNNSKKTIAGRPQKKRGKKKQNMIPEKIHNSTECLIETKISFGKPAIKKTSSHSKNILKKQKRRKKIRSSVIKNKLVSVEQKEQTVEVMGNQAIVSNEITEDEIEDMPLLALSNKNSELERNITDVQLPTETEFLNEIVQSTQKDNTATNKRTLKKKGRPKRSGSNNATQINDQNENNVFVIEKINEIKINYTKEEIVEPAPSENNSEHMERDKTNEDANIQDSFELEHNDNHNKRTSKKPIMSDFEYNIDSIVKNYSQDDNDIHRCSDLSESESNSKRPIRRKVKKNLHYDEGSDEDPYANVELSDDEPRRRKGGRYYSDDEYIPGDKRQISDLSDSDIDEEGGGMFELLEDCMKKKQRRHRKSESGSANKSPRKRSKKGDLDKLSNLDVTENSTPKDGDGDLEDLLETSVIKTNEDAPKPWGTVEFKNFLAKISQGTDIKIKKTKSFDNTKTPIQIPVIDPVEAKKTVEMCCQTNVIKTKPIAIQTNNVHEVPMKSQVALTSEQSDKACAFLSGIVKTTAELGQLMTQKSEDFIEKKINTKYVTDTFKMDYCVKKSFLLFRLAKHNLVQMEEDLAKQYEEFLKENKLIQHREEQKIIEATCRAPSSDSDCEIVEEPVAKKKEIKAAFNPKTVFLNKELSIKIAKKPNEEPKSKEKLNIKGRHTVWINDSIMVKKVKPIQSFLAQDSRNKKPPDSYITLEKVSKFFKMYNRQKAVSVCAQFVTPEWLNKTQNYTCCYFFDKTTDYPETSSISDSGSSVTEIAFSELSSVCQNDTRPFIKYTNICPESLLILCTKLIQKQMHLKESIKPKVNTCNLLDTQLSNDINKAKIPDTKHFKHWNKNILNSLNHPVKIELLKTLCCKKIIELMHTSCLSENSVEKKSSNNFEENNYGHKISGDTMTIMHECNLIFKEIKPLFLLCLKVIQDIQRIYRNANITVIKKISYEPNMLKSIVLKKIQDIFYKKMKKIKRNSKNYTETQNCIENFCDIDMEGKLTLNLQTSISPISLKSLCFIVVRDLCEGHYKYLYNSNIKSDMSKESFNVTINCVSNVSKSKFINNIDQDFNNKQLNYFDDIGKPNRNHGDYKNFDCNPNYVSNTSFEDNTIFKNKSNFGDISNFEDSTNFEDNTNFEDTTNFEENSNFVDSNNFADNSNFEDNTNFDDITNFEDSTHFDDSANFENSANLAENSNFGVNTKFKVTINFDDDSNLEDISNFEDDTNVEGDNNWVSQVQMKELRSFIESTDSNEREQMPEVTDSDSNSIVNIKIEPLEETPEQIGSNVKTEPLDVVVDDTILIPSNVVTKQENIDSISSSQEPIHRQNSNSYDENTFEAFVSSNKMIMAMTIHEQNNEEVFTQSTSRVRRQYEPDSDDDNDNFVDSLNLLIPQNVEKAKDGLMESSSDEDSNKKKKPEKRRGRPRKITKVCNLPPVKEHLTSKSDLAILTRKMKEKIRQAEKQNESSGSDLEDTVLSVRKEKEKWKKKHLFSNQIQEKEIQCSDVDSTEQIIENEIQVNENDTDKENNITLQDENNKTFVDNNDEQNHCSNANSQLDHIDDRSVSPLLNTDEPVELLECEPAFPIFDHIIDKECTKRKLKKDFGAQAINPKKTDSPTFIDRHGWNCYPIDSTDSKIYRFAYVRLDKLPESFVETYFKYQDLSDQTKDDTEVDNLTNLQSLIRIQRKDKVRAKLKDSKNISIDPKPSEDNTQPDNSLPHDIKIEFDELSPSEDEDSNFEIISTSPTQAPSTESCLAKDLLMNDDSDSEKPNGGIKTNKELHGEASPSKVKNGEKETKEIEKVKADNLMLTADKMMNKELALLHAPVDIKEEIPDVKDTPTKPATRNAVKTASKVQPVRDQPKGDDSSSEEEKQWFTTKEKLLKRLEKKQELSNVDDAKRAKKVDEFIVKRTDDPTIRVRTRPSRRRSYKKLLERRKQMKILTRELLGEDSSHTGKKSSQTYGKGRRNIRKVLDKKSLAHSTVRATVEEFERKQRQSMRQAKLREALGFEEGVNVVVINDELCLEYDFEQMRPLVSVHPYFTKVMKAHQYEGVKFMWDVCFESVAQVANEHAGGGCILAHCMGLGKTLQVLALLHTVLTHPQVGMQRVLVCCPLSTVLNWVDEIHKWIGPVTRDIKVFELSKLKKTYERAYQLEDWYNGGGIFIIGYELFRNLTTLDPVLDCVKTTTVNKIRMALLKPGPDIIICDEGHLLKNDSSVLAVAMSRVTTKRRIVLTGTPMQNNLREYFCMVNFVKPNLLGSYTEYSNRYENPIMNGQHRDSREEDIKLMKYRTHILHKVLEGCLQRQEASVLYPFLPKKHEYTVFVSLTKTQKELYTHYLMSYSKETKQSVLKDFHVLQKIWTHPQVLHNFFMKPRDDEKEQKIKVEKEDDLVQEDLGASEDIKPNATETWWLPYVAESDVLDSPDSSNKFLVVFRLLEECIALGDKVLIFSTSLYTMDALEYFLRRINNWSLGREYYRLDGSVPAEVRQKWCREFNAEVNTETKLFLISTRAGSLGLNMTAANRVIILDTSWNPAHDIQSIFRVYRFGQKKDCYIYRLVAMGTMEQKIYERSVTKQAVACRVVDEQQIDRHYNMSELSELYRLDEDGTGVSAGLATGVRDEALLRVAGTESAGGPLLYAVHEHDSLLRGSAETALAEDERAAVWHQFQEEHANKHIQNIAMNIPNKNSNFLTPSTENNINNQSVPSATVSKAKSKRGRKSSKVTNNTPVQPFTSSLIEPMAVDPDLQEEATKKIMNILIQHNFHTTRPLEASELISNVREYVTNLKNGTLTNVDPIIESIAKVVLGDDTASLYPVPLANNINTEQIPTPSESSPTELSEIIVGTPENDDNFVGVNENENQTLKELQLSIRKSRRNQKKEADLNTKLEQTRPEEPESAEIIVGTPVDCNNTCPVLNKYQDSVDPEYSERKRRRQRRDSDEEYVPEKQKFKNMVTYIPKPKTRKSNENKLVPVSTNETSTFDDINRETGESLLRQHLTQSLNETDKIKERDKRSDPETQSGLMRETNTQHIEVAKNMHVNVEQEQVIESILLSDDDEPLSVTPVRQEHSTTQPKNKTDNKERIKCGVVDDSIIPLHKSLLINENFIKIVAHTYLSGNPMLDEEAAILAARYNTSKSLTEIESTGKSITSGPIYDIALQILGKNLLKDMYNAGSNKKDSDQSNIDSTRVGQKTVSNTPKKSIGTEDKDLKMSHESDVIEKKKKAGPKRKTEKRVMEPSKSASITQMKEDIQNPSSSTSAPPVEVQSMSFNTSNTPEVVPVEMFEGPSTLRASYPITSQDECILPDDDDDDIIIGQSPSPPFISTSKDYARRNSRSLLVNSVTSDDSKYATQPKLVQFVDKQSVGNPIPLPPPPVILTATNDTITGELPSHVQHLSISENPPIILNKSFGTSNSKSVPIVLNVGNASQSALKNSNDNLSSTPGAISNETICLDSDDEDITHVNTEVSAPIGKALKSTTKLPSVTSYPINVAPTNQVKSKNKKIILIPASDFANTEPSKNKKQPPGVLKSKQTESRYLDTVSGDPIIIDQTDTTSTSTNSHKRVKCQPGDIVRLNKGGKIEILRKSEKTISSSIPKTSLSKLSTRTVSEEFITGDIVENTMTAQKHDDPINSQAISGTKIKPSVAEKIQKTIFNVKETIERARTSNSASNDPSDPLLVLKNVIKIPVNKYQAIKLTGFNDASIQKGILQQQSYIPKEVVANNTIQGSKNIENHQKTSLNIKNKISSEKDNIRLSNEKSIKTPDTIVKTFEVNKAVSKEPKSKVIDLTDCFAITNDVARPVKNVVNKNIKMSGSSKDIIINRSGTLMSSAPNKPAISTRDPFLKVYPSSSNSLKKSKPTPSQKPPINEGKRTISLRYQNTVPYKKKKAESHKPQMTLEDFNVDDLDDIIELE